MASPSMLPWTKMELNTPLTEKRGCSARSRQGATMAFSFPPSLLQVAKSLIVIPMALAYFISSAVIFVMPSQ